MFEIEKIIVKIPKKFKSAFHKERVSSNYHRIIIISALVLLVQLGVFFISLSNPFTTNEAIIERYHIFYAVYTSINFVMILIIINLKKLKSTVPLSISMAVQIVLLNQWAMGVAIADLFQGQEIVVYFMSMFVIAIFLNIGSLEFLLAMLLNYFLFIYQLEKFYHVAGLEASYVEPLIAAAQFLIFATIIRFVIEQLHIKNFIYRLELEQMNKELEYLSYFDSLSTVYNRRKFENEYHTLFTNAVKESKVVGVALIDIDFFKQYNDNYGHIMGDKVIRNVGAKLKKVCNGRQALYGRYGGDEFIVAFVGDDNADGINALEQLRSEIEQLNMKHEKSITSDTVSISIGYYSSIPFGVGQSEEFVILADKDLYEKKRMRFKN